MAVHALNISRFSCTTALCNKLCWNTHPAFCHNRIRIHFTKMVAIVASAWSHIAWTSKAQTETDRQTAVFIIACMIHAFPERLFKGNCRSFLWQKVYSRNAAYFHAAAGVTRNIPLFITCIYDLYNNFNWRDYVIVITSCDWSTCAFASSMYAWKTWISPRRR